MQVGDQVFVSYPSAVHYGEKGAATATRGKKPLNQLLWGDWARILEIGHVRMLLGATSTTSPKTIYSPELARSSSEKIKHPNQVRRELRKKIDDEQAILHDPDATAAAKKRPASGWTGTSGSSSGRSPTTG